MTRRIIALLAIFVFNLIAPLMSGSVLAAGATLFISPSTGSYEVGKNFTVKIMVNSGGGVGINAGEGVVNFDSSALLVSSVSKGGSIFNLWTTEPTYSNTAGTISFGGGSPTAYKGDAGSIFSVTFSAKKEGETELKFNSGTILAADGKGTNVFSGFGNAKYTIKAKEEKKPEEKPTETKSTKTEEETKPTKGILPPLPEISSKTHSETEVWYSNNDPEFDWKVLPDLTSVSYIINENATADPGSNSDGVIESKKFEDVKDGIWYFHLKYKNSVGWSQIAHRKFLVDVTAPDSFMITVDNGGDETNPTPKLKFKTNDSASGIDYFSLNIDNRIEKLTPESVSRGYYETTALAPGEHNINLSAVDRAGNAASSSVSFIVEPLKQPIITSIPKTIRKGDELIIQGTSFYPKVTVKVYISDGKTEEPQEYSVKTDDSGNWSYFHKGILEKGNYDIWAKIVDDRGAQSLNSSRQLLIVESLSIIESFGLYIIIFLLVLIILLLLYIYYIQKKFNEEKVRIKRETQEVKIKLGKIFSALREEVDELIQMADKKPGLSESERRVKEKLQESLDISEEFIGKEVEDVEKEIKMPQKKSK